MNLWIAKGVVLAATLVIMAIRAPHGRRSRSVKVAKSHKTPLARRSCRSDDIAYDMISECLGALFSIRMSSSRLFAVTVVRREYS
jgi:hypothetical protein